MSRYQMTSQFVILLSNVVNSKKRHECYKYVMNKRVLTFDIEFDFTGRHFSEMFHAADDLLLVVIRGSVQGHANLKVKYSRSIGEGQ